MNYTDIVFLLIILLGLFIGYKRGSIFCVTDMISLVAAFFSGWLLQRNLLSWLNNSIPSFKAYNIVLAFAIPACLCFAIFSILLYFLKKNIPENITKHRINKLSGIVVGLLFAISISYILLQTSNRFSFNDDVTKDIETSSSYKIASIFSGTPKNEKTEKVKNYERIAAAGYFEIPVETTLPFKTDQFTEREDLEAAMLDIINRERSLQHLPLLMADEELARVAAAHSKDMLQRGYFNHNTPEGLDPFKRMKNAKIVYVRAGENLAISHDLYKAHVELMLSPAHRANILNPGFGRIGIGILDAGEYGLMISQEFRN